MKNRVLLKQVGLPVVWCLATAILLVLWVRHNDKKIAVVDAVRLFNGFQMKKDMESSAAASLEQMAHQVDSIRSLVTVKQKAKGVAKEDLDNLQRQLQSAEEAFEQIYRQSNQSINEQVWRRLNPMIDAYGKAHHLRLIIGANGRGSVLYNQGYYDHTDELIHFINEQYENME